MSAVPFTHVFDFSEIPDVVRPLIMREFAANGAAHLVLSDHLFAKMLGTPSFKPTLKRDLADTGMDFVDAHAPFGPYEDLNCPDPAARPQMIARHKVVLNLAAEFGVGSITIHVGNTLVPGYPLAAFRQAALESLEILLPLAEKLKIVICIENIWFPTNTPEELLFFIDYFKSPWLGLCFDSGHANLMSHKNGAEAEKSDAPKVRKIWDAWGLSVPWDDCILEKMLPHLVNCHLHDNHGNADEHLVPGNGNIDWPRLMKTLARAPRLACVQNESLSPRRGNPTSIAETCREYAKLAALMLK